MVAAGFKDCCTTVLSHPELVSGSHFINFYMLKQVQYDNYMIMEQTSKAAATQHFL